MIPVMPIVFGIFAVLVVLHLSVVMRTKGDNSLAEVLRNKWDQMQPQKERTEKIDNEIKELGQKAAAVKEITRPKLSWTKLLLGLNQAVIQDIWLSELDLSFPKGERGSEKEEMPISLNITGYALGRSEKATLLVAQFINSMKNDQDFSSFFGEIELQNMKNLAIAEEEVMMFSLNCYFKAEAAPKAKAKAVRKK